MMIKFNLANFEPVPEGERRLTITEAKCTPSGKPTKIELTFEDDETKRVLKSSYSIASEGAMRAFGFLCRVALDIPDLGEFDTNDIKKLVNIKLLCIIEHTEGTTEREDGTLPVFANIRSVLERLNDEPAKTVTSTSPRNSIPSGDLD